MVTIGSHNQLVTIRTLATAHFSTLESRVNVRLVTQTVLQRGGNILDFNNRASSDGVFRSFLGRPTINFRRRD